MKFLAWSSIICVVSFTLCGVFYGYADFSDIEKKVESGKYNFHYSTDEEKEEKDFGARKETFKPSEVKKISIQSSISEVKVRSKNVDKIKVEVEFLNEKVEETYSTELENGELKIKTGEESSNQGFASFFGNNKNGCKISIDIPNGLELDYSFKLALGSLEMEELEVGAFEAKLAAGNIEVDEVSFKSALIKAAAGNVELDSVKVSEEMEIKAAAGNVEIDMAQADPNIKIKAAAGNVVISFDGVEPDLKFTSLSTVGEVSVRSGYKSADGDASTYTYGDGKGSIEVKSTFGNVKIR